jgi:diguanylate cyclase (GGDEF)-like protein/PAS domain S-box-containing protein
MRSDSPSRASEAELSFTLLERQAMLDNALLGIAFAREQKFLHCNKRFTDMFGWPDNELAGQPIGILHPSDGACAELQGITSPPLSGGDGQRQDSELLMRKRDGTLFWCRLLCNPIDPADPGKGSIFIADDITERKAANESTRQTMLEYGAILENASVGIIFTRDRKVLHANTAAGEMFDWPTDELVGQPASIFYPSAQAYAELGRAAGPVLSSGKQFDTELTLKRRDGSTFWCRMLAKAIDPANNSKGTIFIAEDITDRKAAEQALQHLLLEYRSILDNASLGITFTRDREFLHCNARFSEMFGWNSNELVGQPTHIVYPSAEAFAEIGRIATPILSKGERLDTEALMMKRDGTVFWARVLAKAIDTVNNGKGTIFIVEDITERKLAQEALVRARDELELRVEERTAELATANALLQAEIQERRAAEERIRHLANHDALTGLPNRRLLEDRIGQALLAAKRGKTQVAIQFIDLDRFKIINDSLGHRIGDLLLQEVARRISSVLREVDTVSRIGGDEFVLVLPDIQSEEAVMEIARRILESVEQPYLIEGHVLSVSPSIGISLYPAHGADVETLINRADSAMYYTKQVGGKGFRLYSCSDPA